MPQEYEVVQFKKGDFKDQNGNFWCDMALKGVGEPVRIVVKDPTQFHDGMTLYGRITEEVGKTSGKPYQRFRREKRDDETRTYSQSAGTTTKKEWQPRDDDAIRAQWAIGQASSFFAQVEGGKASGDDPAGYRRVEEIAKQFYAMVDRVKGSSVTQEPTVSPEELQARRDTQRDAERLKATVRDDDISLGNMDEPINMDDIPF